MWHLGMWVGDGCGGAGLMDSMLFKVSSHLDDSGVLGIFPQAQETWLPRPSCAVALGDLINVCFPWEVLGMRNHRIVKVGKALGDHQIQPFPHHCQGHL